MPLKANRKVTMNMSVKQDSQYLDNVRLAQSF